MAGALIPPLSRVQLLKQTRLQKLREAATELIGLFQCIKYMAHKAAFQAATTKVVESIIIFKRVLPKNI